MTTSSKRQAMKPDTPTTCDRLRAQLERCGDVTVRRVVRRGDDETGRLHYTVFYVPGMVDFNFVTTLFGSDGSLLLDEKVNPLVEPIEVGEAGKPFFDRLFAGDIMLLADSTGSAYAIECPGQPSRSIEESTLELSVKGPRDGFVEAIGTNLSLIRTRLRTPRLAMEWFSVGSESQTRICLLHMEGITNPQVVEEARHRLRNIDVLVLHGAGELEVMIADRSVAMVPTIQYVGRPDFVVQSLMNGRFAIVVDGSPAALIAPVNISYLVKSPEDAYLPFYFVSFERLIRLISFLLAGMLPGFWLALLAYNNDQVPFTLLATVTMSRFGLPLSPQMELFLMMFMFEVFREAGVRLPRAVGQTVTVVGGLIVGDAAIRAGLTSPTMLVITAVTAVSTFTLVNQSLNGSVTVIRLFIIAFSAVLGLLGFFVSVFAVLLYLCSLESFGMPYMQPLAPISFRKLATAVLQLPWKYRAKRSS
ncbi:spore germination protein [Paenibacillus lycopersici]|uniref:Spore germination protein n=1 Tax=Paenibacillus lycopersici TaxID=2704462 RepID=A0A6C0G2H5_9BACL|nr:spore germination protein [Paenibacillus lycopersici]QHT62133.1 spore germination protein [Paenibacillus lycopersici]